LHPKGAKKSASSRDDRLKAALKANLSRRKQVARARAATDKAADETASSGEAEQTDTTE
jgi:hypothetical protein